MTLKEFAVNEVKNYTHNEADRYPSSIISKMGFNVIARAYGLHHNRYDGEWHEHVIIEKDKDIFKIDIETNIYDTSEMYSDILDSTIVKTATLPY
jgi:hypothetical protein